MSLTAVPQRTPVLTVLRSTDRPFLALSVAARLPTAMLPLGLLLYVADRTGSFATGGLAVAALSIGGGLGGPVVGLLADRHGQRRTALLATATQGLALTSLLLAESLGAVLLLAAAVGSTNPQAGSMSRSRWAAAARGRSDRRSFTSTAMAWEGAVDETSFVMGPVLVGTVATLASPKMGLLLTLLLAVTTQIGFARHPSALPGEPDRGPESRDPWPLPHVAALLLVAGAIGVVFGATQTGVAARLAETGQDALTGPVYALLGLGSAIAGLLATRLPDSVWLPTRIGVGGALLTLVGAGSLLAAGPAGLAVCCLGLGVALGPALVSSYALAERSAPRGRATSMMTALGTANVVGVAAGAAAAGLLVERISPAAALLTVAVAGLLVTMGGVAAAVTDPGRRTN